MILGDRRASPKRDGLGPIRNLFLEQCPVFLQVVIIHTVPFLKPPATLLVSSFSLAAEGMLGDRRAS